ncbi:SDR family NAD(P)-dependent oxidoreductase [Marinobacter arenosus]|uniref:SDR family NAD(P)-dependent oxidoreductase n=1 Tax=Marinobacter arenosus TaxID=2856822 RepID=UPI001C4D71A1|nr:SDR family NAD(P)-dependent oxidoreductase [Marinobacter arenosus]MBW0146240.1 SDR family NAD(P)-dependent oxidoreductase [Marinobacter arenosus]
MKRVEGKVAAVTRGFHGIGAAAVTRLAEEGASVAILDCLDKEGEALARKLVARGYTAH